MLFLLFAAVAVGVVHAALPDHWVPLAVVARSQRWSTAQTVRTTLWAAGGHVVGSVAIGALVIALGSRIAVMETAMNRIVGDTLIVTGVGLLIWAMVAGRHGRDHPSHGDHSHDHHTHTHTHTHGDHSHTHHLVAAGDTGVSSDDDVDAIRSTRVRGWAASLAVPFGVAASPDLTILPVFFAASPHGIGADLAVIVAFAAATVATFLCLTLAAKAGVARLEWPWLERNAEMVSALILVALGIMARLAL